MGFYSFCKFLAVISIFAEISVNGQALEPRCSNECRSETTCTYRARQCLALRCGDNYDLWYKTGYGQINHLLYQPGSDYGWDTDSTGRFRAVIRELSQKDIGLESYFSLADANKTYCSFNIFVFDPAYYVISLKLNNNEILPNSALQVEIDSFLHSKVKFFVRMEALPIDGIRFDDKVPASVKCKASAAEYWLDCYNATFDYAFEKCVNRKQLTITNYVRDETNYLSANGYKRPSFDLYATILYPPKTLSGSETIYPGDNSSVTLECQVACGNPEVYLYTWTDSNGDVLIESTSNLYTHVLAPFKDQEIVVICTVTNTITTKFPEESQTKFRLIVGDPPSTITTTATATTPSSITTPSAITTPFITLQTSRTTIHPTYPAPDDGLSQNELAVIIMACVGFTGLFAMLIVMIVLCCRKHDEDIC